MKSANKSNQYKNSIPIDIESQHEFFAQFCKDLCTITEINESQSNSSSTNEHSENIIKKLLQMQTSQIKEQKITSSDEWNKACEESSSQLDDKKQLLVPGVNIPKFISFINFMNNHKN